MVLSGNLITVPLHSALPMKTMVTFSGVFFVHALHYIVLVRMLTMKVKVADVLLKQL